MPAVLPDSTCRIVVPTCQMLTSFERKETSWANTKNDLSTARSAPATDRTAQSGTRFSDQNVCVTSQSMWEEVVTKFTSNSHTLYRITTDVCKSLKLISWRKVLDAKTQKYDFGGTKVLFQWSLVCAIKYYSRLFVLFSKIGAYFLH